MGPVINPIFMLRCLELAERGRGKVGVNPLVGAMLVRGEGVIAEGWHEGFGLRHAERALLEDFHGDIRPEDSVYVNLEPCCHRGKTLPCTDILLERKVKRVVYGMVDPNEKIAGKGIEALRRAHVEVTGPVERARSEWLNRGFVSLHTRGRPWVTLKKAQTKAGEIAAPTGAPLKITSPAQDAWAHRWLRARHDAILVGVETVMSDNPKLTVRLCGGGEMGRGLLRVVLDPHLRIPLEAAVVKGEYAAGTMVISSPGNDPKKRAALQDRGVLLREVPLQGRTFVWQEFWKALTAPQDGFSGIASLLVEGGAATWQSFRDAGMVDEEVVLIGN